MSSDAFLQPNLQNKQRLNERKQLETASIRRNKKMTDGCEKCRDAKKELDEKAQQLCLMRLQDTLEKKREEQTLKQLEELLSQKSRLMEQLAKIKSESKKEEQTFLEEISRFNDDFSLVGNRDAVLESQMRTELLDLEREEESLRKGMELMRQTELLSLEEEKKRLLLELQRLDNMQKDLDWQLNDAKATTESLRSESLIVSQKPLTDSTCLRLKKELEMLKEEELAHVHDSLSSEIHFLQSKLDGGQDGEQH